jgi:hypothetical protein
VFVVAAAALGTIIRSLAKSPFADVISLTISTGGAVCIRPPGEATGRWYYDSSLALDAARGDWFQRSELIGVSFGPKATGDDVLRIENMSELSIIGVNDATVSDELMTAISQLESPSRLTLTRCEFRCADAVESVPLDGIRSVSVSSSTVPPCLMRSFVAADRMYVYSSSIGDDSLAVASDLPHLRSLDLSNCVVVRSGDSRVVDDVRELAMGGALRTIDTVVADDSSGTRSIAFDAAFPGASP